MVNSSNLKVTKQNEIGLHQLETNFIFILEKID